MQDPNAVALIELLRSVKATIAVAESCTGGLLGAALTSIPGSSEVFLGSAVTYSNRSKISVLGVDKEIIDAYGAVSQKTASAMARGAVKIFGSHVGISITGIAGPGGGTEEKPVGTVCIAVTDGFRSLSSIFNFDGDRETIRNRSVTEACGFMIDFIEGRV